MYSSLSSCSGIYHERVKHTSKKTKTRKKSEHSANLFSGKSIQTNLALLCCVMVRIVEPCLPIIAPTISLGTRMRSGKSVARDDGPKPQTAFRAFLGPPGPRLFRLGSIEGSTRNLFPSYSVLFNSFMTLMNRIQNDCHVQSNYENSRRNVVIITHCCASSGVSKLICIVCVGPSLVLSFS